MKIVHYWVDAHVNYSSQESDNERFIPQPHHNYDVIVKSDSVSIADLDPQANITEWDGEICKKTRYEVIAHYIPL